MAVFLRVAVLKLHQACTGRHVLARPKELNRTQWIDWDAL